MLRPARASSMRRRRYSGAYGGCVRGMGNLLFYFSPIPSTKAGQLQWLYRLYPSLLDAIIIVQPETVIRWHQRGFRAYWRWKSRHIGGRPRINAEVRALIRRMNREHPLWGAPRIHR